MASRMKAERAPEGVFLLQSGSSITTLMGCSSGHLCPEPLPPLGSTSGGQRSPRNF
ncbi:hypothetical protein BS50DRAFT_579814 [Corynespora cassiicola Philippines]|uniref:Uncharacterized protein n=1 Tax=Corynespora cassiicola Philippines TaxID=1448308 RepID=A0A2T2N2Z5_CORCC|nr:hypothetical protein BS50DRAFT_579814 [Corynespora cassiicola Philippines]